LLQNIILCRSPQLVLRDPLVHSNSNVEREQNRRGSVDCHASTHPSEVDALEETPHVMEAADSNPDPANFSSGPWMIRVEAELCWKVECRAESGLTVRYQVLEAPVGFSR